MIYGVDQKDIQHSNTDIFRRYYIENKDYCGMANPTIQAGE